MDNKLSVTEIIKNAPLPIWQHEPARPELSIANQFYQRFGALRLYGDFYVEWLYARAVKKEYFRWGWGRLNFNSIMVFEGDRSFCPIMEFDEFYALLQVSYINFQ